MQVDFGHIPVVLGLVDIGDFACSQRYNLIHGSDSPESAEMEINLYFEPDEILEYDLPDATWLDGYSD